MSLKIIKTATTAVKNEGKHAAQYGKKITRYWGEQVTTKRIKKAYKNTSVKEVKNNE